MQHKYLYRFLALLLALVLAFELLPTGVLAANTQTQHTSELQAEGDAAQEVLPGEASNTVVGEVEEYRDERVKHFRMEDGSFLAVDYGVPVHYALDKDTWVDIDNTLIPQDTAYPASAFAAQAISGAAQQYAAVNGDDTKTFSSSLSTGFLFSAQRGNSSVGMSLMDGLTVPTDARGALPEESAIEAEAEPTVQGTSVPETQLTLETAEVDTSATDETLSAEEPAASGMVETYVSTNDLPPALEVTEETVP